MQKDIIKVIYFARLKEAVGVGFEEIEYSSSTTNVERLMKFICDRNSTLREEFNGSKRIRAAVNQSLVPFTTELNPGDEIAFFPPVTGG